MIGRIITRGRNSGLKCLSTGSLPPFLSLSLLFFSPNREPVYRLHRYLPPKLLQYVAYAATLCSHGRAEAGEHKLEHILLSKYINSRDSFYWQMFLEPLTLDIINTCISKVNFCDLRPYKRTFYESFSTLSIITTKNEANSRVDSTVSVGRKVGYMKIYPENTREIRYTVLIHYYD